MSEDYLIKKFEPLLKIEITIRLKIASETDKLIDSPPLDIKMNVMLRTY